MKKILFVMVLLASICISTTLATSGKSAIAKPARPFIAQKAPMMKPVKTQELQKIPTTPVQKKSIFGTIYIRLKDGRLIIVR